MDIDVHYFTKLMCENYGVNKSFEVLDSPNFDIGSFKISKDIQSKMNDYYLNNLKIKKNVDEGKVTIFAFEGAGSFNSYNSGKAVAQGKYSNIHPNGRFGAMMVVMKGAKITYVTSNASTLPDKIDNIAVTKEDIYEYRGHSHHGTYPAIQLKDYSNAENHKVPAYYNGVLKKASGINIHTANSNVANWSAGCQIIHYSDYVEFGNAVGFTKDSNRNMTYYNPTSLQGFAEDGDKNALI